MVGGGGVVYNVYMTLYVVQCCVVQCDGAR